jgi:glycyl-tRNA synthetase
MQVAQVGKSFRNEINPKNGLIRQREFMMAEIEHFIDPSEKFKSYKKFKNVENLEVNLYTEKDQQNQANSQTYRLRDAVDLVQT